MRGVSRGNLEKCEGWPLWRTPALLPVAKGMNAYTHGSGESRLGEAHETPQRYDVVARFDLTKKDSLARARWDCTSKLLRSQFRNVGHWRCSNDHSNRPRAANSVATQRRRFASAVVRRRELESGLLFDRAKQTVVFRLDEVSKGVGKRRF